MASRTGAARVVLSAWASALLVGAVAGVVVVEPRGSQTLTPLRGTVPSAPVPSTSASAAPAPETTAPPATTVPAADGRAPASTTPPAPGGYRYHLTSTGADGKASETDRTTITTRIGQDGEDLVQRMTTQVATGGGDASAVATTRWGPRGVVTSEWLVKLYGGAFTCAWQPAATQYPPQLTVGSAWAVDSSCSGKVEGGQLDGNDAGLRLKGTRKITAAKVDDTPRAIPTWTVAAVTDLQLTAGGLSSTTHSEGTEQYAPTLGMVTRTDATVTVDSFGQKKTSRMTSALLSTP